MKVLIAGATGYIGSRLSQLLLEQGHTVYAISRTYVPPSFTSNNLKTIPLDLLVQDSSTELPKDVDAAFFLVHAMSYGKDFPDKERRIATNFISLVQEYHVKQVIYLSGLTNDTKLSPHLASRYETECMIKESGLPYTILKAGIIIGSGSASFEIIRDLAEKLPIMVAPRWVNNLCQPIGVKDVLTYLSLVMLDKRCINQVFDIGGPKALSYKDMLLKYAQVRGLKRRIYVVPVLTPRLSSYWLYFITSVNFSLACSLVDSLKNEAVCHEGKIKKLFPHKCLSYEESISLALDVIEQNPLLPSWKDSQMTPELESRMSQIATVPSYGCYIDQRRQASSLSKKELIERVWSLGGSTGWYYMNWAWKIRGFIDKLLGGVGLQRGRSYSKELRAGASLDFWRVITADKDRGYLLLYAEMKLPGEAWLEFRVEKNKETVFLIQTASFRPKGLLGSLYWFAIYPIHVLVFRGMAKKIAG